MSAESRITLDRALQAVRLALQEIQSSSDAAAPEISGDELFARLADICAPDGTILLEDGSRLDIIPEHGDRGGDTGRVGVIQRFPDQRPDRTHIVGA